MLWTTGLKEMVKDKLQEEGGRKKPGAQPQPPLGQAPQPLSQNQAQTQPQVQTPQPLVQNEALGNPMMFSMHFRFRLTFPFF